MVDQNKLKEISKNFTYQDFHAKIGHYTLRGLIEKLNKIEKLKEGNQNEFENPVKEFLKHFQGYLEARQKHDIASIISVNPKRFDLINILVIDDNKETANELKDIIKFLPDDSEIWLTESSEYKKFLYDSDFLKKLHSADPTIDLKLIRVDGNGNSNSTIFNDDKFKFNYVVVDLLLGNYNEGNKIIRELVKFRDIINRGKELYKKSFFFILALSMSDDVEDVFRAYNEGALGYVWKFTRIYSLPYIIGTLEPARKALEEGLGISAHSHARNFSKLYHLPPRIEWKLRTEPFLEPLKKNDYEIDSYAKDVARYWIEQLPKAELHFHLGGSMDENIIFYLSVNTVAHLKIDIENIYRVLDKIIDQLTTFFNNSEKDDYEKCFRKFYECCLFILENNIHHNFTKDKKLRISLKLRLFHNIKLKEKNNIKDWLKQLSNTTESTISYIKKFEDKPAEIWFDYLTYNLNKDGFKLKKSDVIALFVVFVGVCIENRQDEAKDFWNIIHNKLQSFKKEADELLKKSSSTENHNKNKKDFKNLKEFLENSKIYKIIEKIPLSVKQSIDQLNKPSICKEIPEIKLKNLVLASPEAKTLNQLLRGDVFFGADNLQYYENIFACVWYLMEKVIKDNVRYLEIRVSPSGYLKEGLTINEAVSALFEGADLCSLYYYLVENKFIWTNFITTAKRHKTPQERAQEINLAVTYSKREKVINDLQDELSKYPNASAYQWRASRIVGVDLAGYEEKFPPSMFVNDFDPIFKICSFITIHAGEETPADYIWQAIYNLHANRIGHGLSIVHHESLMSLVRDMQICIELCPTSNKITNNLTEGRISKYPLYKFMIEGLNVTINTDDCATTGKTLSDEYVQAAEFFYFSEDNNLEVEQDKYKKIPITKWEILRIVKAGFDNAFINREEKSDLLRWVEEEIYEKIFKMYGVEPNYPVDY